MAGALLIAPLVVAAQALPASAATGKLLVTTIARDGKTVTSQVDCGSYQPDGLAGLGEQRAGHQRARRPVRGASGDQRSHERLTVAGAIVTVSGTGTTKVTLDGRKGKPLNVTLNVSGSHGNGNASRLRAGRLRAART